MNKVEAEIDSGEIAALSVGSLGLEDMESHPLYNSNITKYTPYNQKVYFCNLYSLGQACP